MAFRGFVFAAVVVIQSLAADFSIEVEYVSMKAAASASMRTFAAVKPDGGIMSSSTIEVSCDPNGNSCSADNNVATWPIASPSAIPAGLDFRVTLSKILLYSTKKEYEETTVSFDLDWPHSNNQWRTESFTVADVTVTMRVKCKYLASVAKTCVRLYDGSDNSGAYLNVCSDLSSVSRNGFSSNTASAVLVGADTYGILYTSTSYNGDRFLVLKFQVLNAFNNKASSVTLHPVVAENLNTKSAVGGLDLVGARSNCLPVSGSFTTGLKLHSAITFSQSLAACFYEQGACGRGQAVLDVQRRARHRRADDRRHRARDGSRRRIDGARRENAGERRLQFV
ncbi:hypothetical protein DIPPA_09260 [Diplonema papillatum]|nr:hypothetical protein DIPPA_09260 [Diplonema papillatum]